MHPTLFQIGPVTIYSYGFFLAVGYLLATYIFWREGKRQGYSEEKLIDFSVATLIAAILGGRFFYTLINFRILSTNWTKVLAFWEGGFAYYGSFFAVFIISLFLIRKWKWSFFQIADIGALAVLSAFVVGKIGSFLSGNDYGKLTGLPWGVTFDFLEGSRHPVQIYEALFGLILLLLLYRYYKFNISRPASLRSGGVFLYFLFFSSLGRLIFEQFRADSTFVGPFQLASLFSFSIAIVSLLALYYYQFRNLRNDVHSLSKYLLGITLRFKNPLRRRPKYG